MKKKFLLLAISAVAIVSAALSVRPTIAIGQTSCDSSSVTVPSDAVSVKDYGAKGDGTSNATASIQSAIVDAAAKGLPLFFPAGTYSVSVNTIKLVSNSSLYLDSSASIVAIPNALYSYQVINLKDVSNVSIAGGSFVGERSGHTGTGGEWGMVLSLSNASHVYLKGLTLRDGWGDGLYVSGKSTDLNVCYTTLSNNRRNNISIVDGSGITLKNLSLLNANGTAPQAGMDIEPDGGYAVSNVTLSDSLISGNNADGIDLVGVAGPVQNITIQNNTIVDSKRRAFVSLHSSNVVFKNNKISNSNTSQTRSIYDIYADTSSNITIDSNTITGGNTAAAIAFTDKVTASTVANNCLDAGKLVNVPSAVTATNNGVCQTGAPALDPLPSPALQDTTPPVISLNDSSTIILTVGDTYVDAGVTATDNVDGDITQAVVVGNNVNTAVAGTYSVTYQVHDRAGNAASTGRAVIVKNAPIVIAPYSEIVPAANTPVAPVQQVAPQPVVAPTIADGFWSFIPFVTPQPVKTSVSTKSITPVHKRTAATAGKKSYDIVSIQYTLNGVLVHTSTDGNENWQVDTLKLQDGTYTLNTFIHYADGTTDNGNNTFVADNTPSLFQRILAFLEKLL